MGKEPRREGWAARPKGKAVRGRGVMSLSILTHTLSFFALGSSIVNAIETEAELMRRFSHPHIVRVVDFFRTYNSAHLVEELLEGVQS